MEISPTIFRAYDIRGVVGQELTPNVFEALGRAYGSEVRQAGWCNVYAGYDGRLSSPILAKALYTGMQQCGCQVYDLGCVPTPLVYFAALQKEGTGVMITGSHNPAQYNGCKCMIGGNTLETKRIQRLYERIMDEDYVAQASGTINSCYLSDHYIETVKMRVPLARPLKVVIDAGNGATGIVAPRLFRALGCQVVELYCDIDGAFPNHHPDPSKAINVRDLQRAVCEKHADIGIAFDGDGDRVGIVDEQGAWILPDRVMMLLARDALRRQSGGKVLFDVKCSTLLRQIVEENQGTAVMWKTGHSLLKKKIREIQPLLAGEMSGHLFICEDWNGADDALFAAAILLQILASSSQPLSVCLAQFPTMISTPEINVAVAETQKFALVERLRTQKDFCADAEIISVDGVRAEFPRGWGLVRASNTTPALTLRFEAEDFAELDRIHGLFAAALHALEPDLDIPPPQPAM